MHVLFRRFTNTQRGEQTNRAAIGRFRTPGGRRRSVSGRQSQPVRPDGSAAHTNVYVDPNMPQTRGPRPTSDLRGTVNNPKVTNSVFADNLASDEARATVFLTSSRRRFNRFLMSMDDFLTDKNQVSFWGYVKSLNSDITMVPLPGVSTDRY